MAADYRPHAARALWHDGGRDGAVESAPRGAPARIRRPASPRRVRASRRWRAAIEGLQQCSPSTGDSPTVTREAFVEGWFRTGDAAVVEDGAFRLLGRSSVDILKSGGHKISALEIEEVLRAHPAIAECVVVGVDDVEWGQRVCCAAELRPGITLGLDELKEWARARLAPYKIPERLRVRRPAAQKCDGQGRQT